VGTALTEDGSDRRAGLLRDGRLGVAAHGAGTAVILDDALVAAVARGGPPAAEQAVTVGAPRDQPLVGLPGGTGVRAGLDAACAAAGFAPRPGVSGGRRR
jgi:hypothetical protein